MYEVATREMPRRSLLCLKRNVNEASAWTLGKDFVGIIRDQRLPRMTGRAGAMFSIYWGEVSADSAGPVEWCRPVPDDEALCTWASEQGIIDHPEQLTLQPEDLGVRITYLASGPASESLGPDCDFAVPFA